MKIEEIKEVLNNISFKESCVDMNWKWELKELEDSGFLIRTTFQRPDTHSGEMGTGYGRWMHTSKDTDETRIVMTAWLCAELIIRHELMEAMCYKGARILNPHKNIDELVFPEKIVQVKYVKEGNKID